MGMFDTVDYVDNCRKCGLPIDEFQSKDGPCELRRLSPRDVRGFYAYCRNCKTWNQWKVIAHSVHVERDNPREEADDLLKW
jgi:hypothetical protein